MKFLIILVFQKRPHTLKAIGTVPQPYLLKQLPKATALINTDQVLVNASDSWLSIFELNPKTCKGTNIFSLYADHAEVCSKTLKNCLDKNKPGSFRHKKTGNSEERWYESFFTPCFDEKENVIGTIIQIDDITKSMEIELELERVNTVLKTKSEVAKVGYWEYDVASENLHWCEETKKIHRVPKSYQPDVAEAIAFYKQGYSRNKISMLFHKAMNDGASFSKRLIIVTGTGEERWVKASGKPIAKNGKIIKLFGTFQDIHEQVLTETKSEENRQLLTTLIDNIPLNVFVKDKDSRKTLVNKAECEYVGLSREEVLGKTDFDLYDKNVAQISRDEDLEVMRSLKPILGKETINIKKDGHTTHFLTSKIPLLDLEGNVNGLMGISMDITHLKKKEDQLRNLINVTAIQNKKLINFAHIVSHNLRSHTANFSMLLEFLMKEEDATEKERILNMLSQASDNLLLTLEDLNQVVAINTNVNLEKKSLKINDVVNKIKQDLSSLLDKNKVEIVNTIPDDLAVSSVPAYLESIILNLMTNAIKYKSSKRKPVINLNGKKQGNYVLFSITDNGLGIDLDRHGGKVFGMYKTFHNRKDSRGLGLYITKNQIEAMGGNITVQSELDKGTTFNVYFNEES